MNMLRNFGKKLGALCLVLDAVKGAVPCILGWLLFGGIGFGDVSLNGIILITGERFGMYAAALSVILGHCYPVFFKFKGGKGIASSIGVCLVFQPIIAAITIAIGIGFVFAFHLGSIGSFIIIGFPLAAEGLNIAAGADLSGVTATVIISTLLIGILFFITVWKHRQHIVKLFMGTESKTLARKKKANKGLALAAAADTGATVEGQTEAIGNSDNKENR
jgi:glycerol-3-phosphate acyltransferase PlsY